MPDDINRTHETDEKTEFVKDENSKTNQYIFQMNTKTIVGAVIIVVFLVILIIAVFFSGIFMGDPQ